MTSDPRHDKSYYNQDRKSGFEFKFTDIRFDQAHGSVVVEDQLNVLGAQGWDLVYFSEIENFGSAFMGQVFRTVWKRAL